jgi:ornithine cyclodeaminase/alanine dehydrogenase
MKHPASVLLLDRQTVSELLTLDECIGAVEGAFAAHAQGRTLTPGLLHVDAERGEFHIKVGGLRGNRTYFAAKVGGGFFKNRVDFGLPNIVGLILLADGTNGLPLAVMEAGTITRLRTGAATAVAAKYLARPDSRTATICGAGIQGEIQLRSLTRVLPIERAFVWARNDSTSFAQRMSEELGLDVRSVNNLEPAARQSDVIVTCTPAKQWFLGRQHVLPGTFIAAVGTDSPDKQEIEPERAVHKGRGSASCDRCWTHEG